MSLEGKAAFVTTGAFLPKSVVALVWMGTDVAVSGFNHLEGVQAVANEIKAVGKRALPYSPDIWPWLRSILWGLDLFVF